MPDNANVSPTADAEAAFNNRRLAAGSLPSPELIATSASVAVREVAGDVGRVEGPDGLLRLVGLRRGHDHRAGASRGERRGRDAAVDDLDA
jgi:hypothetical protein